VPKKRAGERQYRLAARRKRALLNMLGGKCEKCGAREQLTIEHKDGRAWSMRKESSWQRMKRCWTEYNKGVRLGALCLSCNSAGGNYWRKVYAEAAELPPVPVEPFDEDSRA
jgi:hypothetical protein